MYETFESLQEEKARASKNTITIGVDTEELDKSMKQLEQLSDVNSPKVNFFGNIENVNISFYI